MNKVAIGVLIVFLAASACAQVRKCTGPDGKLTFSDTLCSSAAVQSATANIPLSTHQAPEQRAQAMAESKDRASADRMEAIQLMLGNGKVGEARTLARTPDERALVADAERAVNAQAKSHRSQTEAAESRRQREIERGQRRRW